MTVNTFVLPIRHFAVNPALPVSETNPADPVKDEQVLVLACSDGQLEVTRYPNAPARPLSLRWRPDTRKPDILFQYYRDPMARVALISDPFRHALAFSTYNSFFHRSLGLLAAVGMTPDQSAQEVTLRQTMAARLKEIDASVSDGTFHPELLSELRKALADLDAAPVDPESPLRALKVHAVLAVASRIAELQLYTKAKHIDAYMDGLTELLAPAQKQALVVRVAAYQASTQPGIQPAPPIEENH